MSDPGVLVGAVAYDPKVLSLWEAMREHFRAHRVAVEFALFSSYDRQVESLLGGHLDMAFNAPLAHVRARRLADGRLMPIAMRDVDRDMTAKVLVRRDAGVQALSDLHGKSLAVGSADSGPSRVVPLHLLRRAGVELEKVQLVPFDFDLGKHGDTCAGELSVLAALHAGRAQAGVVSHRVWLAEQVAGHVDPHKVEVLWTTPPFDDHCLDALRTFPEARAQAFQRVLFELRWNNPKHRKLLELDGQKQWVPAREEGYDAVDAALEASAPP